MMFQLIFFYVDLPTLQHSENSKFTVPIYLSLSSALNINWISENNLDVHVFILLLKREEDADQIFRDAEALNLTGEGYAWIVSEQALTSTSVPEGKDLYFRLSIYTHYFTFNTVPIYFC